MEWLAPWLWARYRAHYAGLLVFQLLFWPIFVIGAGMIAWAVALHQGIGNLLFVGGTFLAVTEACGGMAVMVVTREARHWANRWGRGDTGNPRKTRDALAHIDRVPVVYGLAGGLPMLVIAPLLGDAVGLPWSVNLGMAVAAAALVVGSGLLGWVIVDAALWPLAAEVDAVLREDGPEPLRRRVSGRLTMMVLLGALMGCWVSGLLVSWAETDEGQYLLAPAVAVVFATAIAIALTPFGVGPVVRPVGDLTRGTERVAEGIFDQRVPVTSDDEFGNLARSFNRMQAGLLERERLQSAFGSYVDPVLAERLLERGSELFEGEELDATVVFIDVVGFTTYSQGRTPGETVARLNELFGILVPILRDHGGHANKFLGDGMLAVFGVLGQAADHADFAVRAAMSIQRAVRERFGDDLVVGIGIASGPVIAGTVGGGGKLEFTLVGDTVNVAARIEELTRVTDDAILIADSTLTAMTAPVPVVDRGARELRGRDGTVVLHAVPVEDPVAHLDRPAS